MVSSLSAASLGDLETDMNSPDAEIEDLSLIILKKLYDSHSPHHFYPSKNTMRGNTVLRGLRYPPEGRRYTKEKRQSADRYIRAMIADEGLTNRMIRSRRSHGNRGNQDYGSALLWRDDRSAPTHDVRDNSLLRTL